MVVTSRPSLALEIPRSVRSKVTLEEFKNRDAMMLALVEDAEKDMS